MPIITTSTGQKDISPLLGPSLQAAIDKVIREIPPDKRGQFQVRVTIQGVEAEAALRLRQNLDAAIYWQKTKDGQAGGARIRWTF